MERRELQLAGWDQGANEKWMAKVHEQCTPDAQGNLVRGYVAKLEPWEQYVEDCSIAAEEETLP